MTISIRNRKLPPLTTTPKVSSTKARLLAVTVPGVGKVYVQGAGTGMAAKAEAQAFVSGLFARGEVGDGKAWSLIKRGGRQVLRRNFFSGGIAG
jgi:hypothetical protein